LYSRATDANYFATTSSNLGAVYIDVTAKFTIVSGSYFGFDTSGTLVPSPADIWIQNNGVNTIIGVDYATSSLFGAKHQRNVFAPANTIVSISSSANNTIVSGNYFGYDITGAALGTSYINAYGVDDQGEDVVTIGTNEDGLGDSIESNWFGCIYWNSLLLRASKARISGNFFGYGIVNQTSPAVLNPVFCQNSGNQFIFTLGDAVILGSRLVITVRC